MNKLATAIALVALCAGAMPAWAVNKCTGTDGKVSFQDAPCQSTSKSEKLRGDARPGGASWQFARTKDEMTGEITCFAVSPTVYVFSLKENPIVRLHVTMRKDIVSLSVQSPMATASFHNDVSGMGIRVGGKQFIPVNRKSSSTALGFQPQEEALVMEQMSSGSTLKLRVRFWPWDSLGDSEEITLAGYKQALALAQDCAKKT